MYGYYQSWVFHLGNRRCKHHATETDLTSFAKNNAALPKSNTFASATEWHPENTVADGTWKPREDMSWSSCGTITKSTSQGKRPIFLWGHDRWYPQSSEGQETFGPSTRQQVPSNIRHGRCLYCTSSDRRVVTKGSRRMGEMYLRKPSLFHPTSSPRRPTRAHQKRWWRNASVNRPGPLVFFFPLVWPITP